MYKSADQRMMAAYRTLEVLIGARDAYRDEVKRTNWYPNLARAAERMARAAREEMSKSTHPVAR